MNEPNGEKNFEHQKWLHELNRADARFEFDRFDKFTDYVNEAAIKSSEIALRAAIIINGGAAVSILAFIGSLISKEHVDLNQSLDKYLRLSEISNSLFLFGFGVFMAAVGIGLSYVTHYVTVAWANSHNRRYEHPYIVSGKNTKRWKIFRVVVHTFAFLSGATALGLFLYGIGSVRIAIGHF